MHLINELDSSNDLDLNKVNNKNLKNNNFNFR